MCASQINFFGIIIISQGILQKDSRIQAIKYLSRRISLLKVLDLFTCESRFIKWYAIKAAALFSF